MSGGSPLRPAGAFLAFLLALLAGDAQADEPAPGNPESGVPEPEEDEPWSRAFPEPRFRGEPPTVPPGQVARAPKDDTYALEVEEHGRVTAFEVADPNVVAVVMTGNPRVTAKDLSIKATTIVVWLDRRETPEMVGYQGLGPAPAEAGAAAPPKPPKPRRASVFGDGILGVYAEGSVELLSGTLAFRAQELYLDPREDYALLVEPRLDDVTSVPGEGQVPLHVRAERARVVGRGFAVFDRASVSTSRANDRIELSVRRLTVEEYGVPRPGEETFFGFRPADPDSRRRYRAAGILLRGERVPLLYWPSAAFGRTEGGGTEFPVRIRRVTTGSRSSLGRYLLVGVGGELGPEDDPWLDWTVELGGYTKRGLAGGLDLRWDRPRAKGRLRTFYVHDDSGEDRTGIQAPNEDRWKVNFENRSELTRTLRLDLEANAFSDRGFNREFFESDERNHKERETYARLRWMSGGQAVTLTQMAHLRDFRTETLLSPEAAWWSESVPLGAGFDLSSEARVGRLEREFDHDLDVPDYEALRYDLRERVYRPFDVGDVRVSPFVGARLTGYAERTDGGEDVVRYAAEGGVRANLQLHRDFAIATGPPLCLDGLRHVVDVDVGAYARAFDEHDPEDVPFFDRHDLEEDRTEVFLGLRNRLETRRNGPFGCRNATVADLRLRLSLWPDEVGPYGKRGPGSLAAKTEGEILPDRLFFRGEASYDLGEATLERGSLGALWRPRDGLSLAAGVRQIHPDVLTVWFDTFYRWSEKWGARYSIARDLDTGRTNRQRVSVFRYSPDHVFEVGVSVRDDGEDFGFFVDFTPAIGGRPRSDPFEPREEIEWDP